MRSLTSNRVAPLTLALACGLAHPVLGQCPPSWGPAPFGSYNGANYGTDMPVDAVTTWLPPGESVPRLVVAGRFNTVAGGSFSRIASWDGSRWLALGSGIGGNVISVIDFNGTLVATGLMSSAGGTPVQNVARWNGSSWQAMGSLNDYGTSLAIHNGFLFVGGSFTQASGVSANRLARWNGASWQAVNAGLNGTVLTLGITPSGPGSGEAMIIGGDFTTANGMSANRIAGYSLNFSPNFWYAMGSGANGSVRAIGTGPGGLYAGGSFTSMGGLSTGGFARWNQFLNQWQVLGGFFNGHVYALESFHDTYSGQDQIVIGGLFPGINNSPNIAYFNGTSYSTPGTAGTGNNGSVFALKKYNGSMIVGGAFGSAGGVSVQNLARWSGNPVGGWTDLRPGPSAPVRCLLPTSAGVYAGGDFEFVLDGFTTAHHIVGVSSTGLGPVTNSQTAPNGANGPVYALGYYTTSIAQPSRLIAGGSFTQAGGLSANNIAQFDLSGWAAMGPGMSGGPVNAIIQRGSLSNSRLIAAGGFSSAGTDNSPGVGQWNGTWNALGASGTGLRIGANPGTGYASASYLGDTIVGGNFTSADGVAAGSIARWNGTAWSALAGATLSGTVRALAVFNNTLIVAGDYTSGSPVLDRAASWNGTSWTSMSAGLPFAGSFSPRALVVHDGALYLGGVPNFIGIPTLHRWTGSAWSAIPEGPAGAIYALSSSQGTLWAGGDFGATQGLATPYLARLAPACYANCDCSATQPLANVADFTCFLQKYAAGDPYANCDGSTAQPTLNVADFTCFLQKYAAGCP
jgi:trimeric autotransporter adhesin